MPVGGVVLGERRIGDHPVEAHQLAALDVQRARPGCRRSDVGVGDAVQEHVHLADRPDAAVVLLAVEAEVARVAAVLLDVLVRRGSACRPSPSRGRRRACPPAGSASRTIMPHHGAGRVELAALLARRVGELADQVLVGGAEQVGELEVLVAQPVLVEVLDQLAQLLVGELASCRPCG